MGNFMSKGSLIIPSFPKHDDILHTKHSSSLFITAPSAWMVIPIKRDKLMVGSWNMGCVDHGDNDLTWVQKKDLAESSRFPNIKEAKAKLESIVTKLCRISWGDRTRIGTSRTFRESTCNGIFKVYVCNCSPYKHRNHLWRSLSQFWGFLPPEPSEAKAFTAPWGMAWSSTTHCASSAAADTLHFPRPTRSVSFRTVLESSNSSSLWRFLQSWKGNDGNRVWCWLLRCVLTWNKLCFAKLYFKPYCFQVQVVSMKKSSFLIEIDFTCKIFRSQMFRRKKRYQIKMLWSRIEFAIHLRMITMRLKASRPSLPIKRLDLEESNAGPGILWKLVVSFRGT